MRSSKMIVEFPFANWGAVAIDVLEGRGIAERKRLWPDTDNRTMLHVRLVVGHESLTAGRVVQDWNFGERSEP